MCELFVAGAAAKVEEEPPAKLLDDLFRKTKALPCIYWLPLTDEQVRVVYCVLYTTVSVSTIEWISRKYMLPKFTTSAVYFFDVKLQNLCL